MSILIDTTILIDYFRKVGKSKTKLVTLANQFDKIAISCVTEFEIFMGANYNQMLFWNALLNHITILPFDSKAVSEALNIKKELKQLRKTIDCADLFIASTAITNKLPFYTLNLKHFRDIETLNLIHD